VATTVLDPLAGPAVPGTGAPVPARERVLGVNEWLPAGEHIRWQGAPDARALARHLLFVRPLAAYFASMIAWWMVANRATIATAAFWTTVAVQVALSALVIGGARALARWIAQSATYAVTDRRLVLRLGIILPLTVNLPLRYIEGAKVKRFADGTGQIALQLRTQERLAWLVLFPHVRPFSFSRPEPLLRGLVDADRVGAVLREAVLAVPADAPDAVVAPPVSA